MANKLTEVQIEDIQVREKKALEFLKENDLTPAAQVISVNLGNDVFGTKVVCYLQDIKYADKPEETKEVKNESSKKVK